MSWEFIREDDETTEEFYARVRGTRNRHTAILILVIAIGLGGSIIAEANGCQPKQCACE